MRCQITAILSQVYVSRIDSCASN